MRDLHPHISLATVHRTLETLCRIGEARKVTVLGTASSESITLTALTLARLMAQQAKVVVVGAAKSTPAK